MHCPSCSHDNPDTTRFCTACGRVLIEDAPRRRRRRSRRERRADATPQPSVAPDADVRATPAPRRRWRPAGLAATAIAAVAIGAYLIQPGDPAAGAPASSLVPLPYRAESVGPLPEAAGPAVAVPEADAKAARWTAVLPDRRPPRDDALPVEPPRTDATAGKGARRLLASAEPAVPVGESAAEPAPAPVIVAAVTPVVRPRTPEQELDDALARCRDGGALDRFLCDQRARIAWCEGRWGQHPQCASGRTADYGQ